jgi:heterotetrameric sarcosine oxidase delta subunit
LLLIECPYCGPRGESEFVYGGESHVERPAFDRASAAEWGDYLYQRRNPKGLNLERWRHAYGCRQWFNLARSTVTHEISRVYMMGDAAPDDLA